MTQGQRSSPGSGPHKGSVSRDEMEKIIIEGDTEALVAGAQQVARTVAELGARSYQLRGLLGDIHQVEVAWNASPTEGQRELRTLRLKLALMEKRARQTTDEGGPSPLGVLTDVAYGAIDVMLERADDWRKEDKGEEGEAEGQKALRRLSDLFEAIVAYRRQYRGRG